MESGDNSNTHLMIKWINVQGLGHSSQVLTVINPNKLILGDHTWWQHEDTSTVITSATPRITVNMLASWIVLSDSRSQIVVIFVNKTHLRK